jgi:hypothetical protein
MNIFNSINMKKTMTSLLLMCVIVAASANVPDVNAAAVRYKTVRVNGLDIFYRGKARYFVASRISIIVAYVSGPDE